MFSKSCKYAIRSVLFLAQHANEDHKLGSKAIANILDVPSPFLAKILQDLSKRKIISSTKGPHGGFYLTKENRQQKLIVVVESMDGLSWYDDCVIGLPECDDKQPCPVHKTFAPVKVKMYKHLSENTIEDFVKKLNAGSIHLGLT